MSCGSNGQCSPLRSYVKSLAVKPVPSLVSSDAELRNANVVSLCSFICSDVVGSGPWHAPCIFLQKSSTCLPRADRTVSTSGRCWTESCSQRFSRSEGQRRLRSSGRTCEAGQAVSARKLSSRAVVTLSLRPRRSSAPWTPSVLANCGCSGNAASPASKMPCGPVERRVHTVSGCCFELCFRHQQRSHNLVPGLQILPHSNTARRGLVAQL